MSIYLFVLPHVFVYLFVYVGTNVYAFWVHLICGQECASCLSMIDIETCPKFCNTVHIKIKWPSYVYIMTHVMYFSSYFRPQLDWSKQCSLTYEQCQYKARHGQLFWLVFISSWTIVLGPCLFCKQSSLINTGSSHKPGGLTLTHKCYPPVCTHLQISP